MMARNVLHRKYNVAARRGKRGGTESTGRALRPASAELKTPRFEKKDEYCAGNVMLQDGAGFF
jgi:hypothetical protein